MRFVETASLKSSKYPGRSLVELSAFRIKQLLEDRRVPAVERTLARCHVDLIGEQSGMGDKSGRRCIELLEPFVQPGSNATAFHPRSGRDMRALKRECESAGSRATTLRAESTLATGQRTAAPFARHSAAS